MIKCEISEQVKQSIKSLNPVDQEIIYLRYYQDLNFNEIALILNLNESTVKTKSINSELSTEDIIINNLKIKSFTDNKNFRKIMCFVYKYSNFNYYY